MRGCGPDNAQTTNVMTRDQHDGGHEVRRDHVRQALDRRAAALRLADHPHDLRQQRVAADALGAHDERSRCRCIGAAGDASPGRFSTGIGSPVIIDSSTELLPSTTTPSTGTLSPGRTRSRSPAVTCCERHRPPRCRRRTSPRRLRRQSQQRPDRAPVRLRARSSRTCPSSTSVMITAAASK